MNHNTARTARLAFVVILSSALLATGGTAASARPDPGPRLAPVAHSGGCPLQRVDSQLVRCDDLTGNGVAAPAFVTER